MFTIDQIKTAHAKVKSGADFPAYIAEIKNFGVLSYETFVGDGHTEYSGGNGFKIASEPKYAATGISKNTNRDQFKAVLKSHQQGQTDYPTFCRDAAKNGVCKWQVDLREMTCTYYDSTGNTVLIEAIPQ